MPRINFKKKGSACRQAGMSLVEAIVALLILAVMGSSITLLLVQISSANNTAKLRNQASSYVDQALEKVRSFDQKNGWVSLSQKGSSSGICYSDGTLNPLPVSCIPSGSAQATCGAGVGSPIIPSPTYAASFAMSVKIITSGNQVQAVSTICWLDKNTWNKIESNTYFYDY